MRLILFTLFVLGALALAVVLLASLPSGGSTGRPRRIRSATSPGSRLDVSLVLGTAPIRPEGGPNVYFVHRLDAAAALSKAGKVGILDRSWAAPTEPAAMRAGLVEHGVPAAAIYDDPAGYRPRFGLRARDVYGQKRLVIVSQRFHLAAPCSWRAIPASRPGA